MHFLSNGKGLVTINGNSVSESDKADSEIEDGNWRTARLRKVLHESKDRNGPISCIRLRPGGGA